MITTPIAINLPLHTDKDGVIRIKDSRITLHTIISTYQLSESPEDIHTAFPTISLADIYAVIAYYLANRADVDAYIQKINAAASQAREQHEAKQPQPTKSELQARLNTNNDK